MNHEKIVREVMNEPSTAVLAGLGAVQGAFRYVVVPEAKNAVQGVSSGLTEGMVAWAALGLGVYAYDNWAIKNRKETMSGAFHRGMEHPLWKFMCLGAIGATALHLTKSLPRKYDVFYGFSEKSKK